MAMGKRVLTYAMVLLALAGCIADDVGGIYLVTEDTPKLYSVPNHGVEVMFHAGAGWTASSSADWLTLTPSQGEGGRNKVVVMTNATNRTKQERSAVLTFESGGRQEQMTIWQRSDYALFDQPTYEVGPEGDTLNISFCSNIDRKNLYVSYQKLDWIGWTEPVANTRTDWKGRLKQLTITPNPTTEERKTFFILITYGSKGEPLPLDTTWVYQRGLPL